MPVPFPGLQCLYARNLRCSPAVRDSNLACVCVCVAGRGGRLFEPPVPSRAGPGRTLGLCGSHTGTTWPPHRGLWGHHTGLWATPQARTPPRTGFGEHWGRGSKTMVFGRFLTLKTVLFLVKHVKLPKKKKKRRKPTTRGCGHQPCRTHFWTHFRACRTHVRACRTHVRPCWTHFRPCVVAT